MYLLVVSVILLNNLRQLGAAGKILPRLKEGTRVGKLVMGKYGLYNPKLRRQAEEYLVS
jgi:hypothetical protein